MAGLLYLCSMIPPSDDEVFLTWWSRRRDQRRRFVAAIWVGLPVGGVLALPILLNYLTGRFWYRRADAVGTSQFNPFLLVVAVAIIAGFTGWLYSRMQWERNEERYHRLLSKRKNTSQGFSEEANLP